MDRADNRTISSALSWCIRANSRSSKPRRIPRRKRRKPQQSWSTASMLQARWFACEADAEAAIAEYEHRGQGRRGRRPSPDGIMPYTIAL